MGRGVCDNGLGSILKRAIFFLAGVYDHPNKFGISDSCRVNGPLDNKKSGRDAYLWFCADTSTPYTSRFLPYTTVLPQHPSLLRQCFFFLSARDCISARAFSCGLALYPLHQAIIAALVQKNFLRNAASCQCVLRLQAQPFFPTRRGIFGSIDNSPGVRTYERRKNLTRTDDFFDRSIQADAYSLVQLYPLTGQQYNAGFHACNNARHLNRLQSPSEMQLKR